MAPTGIHYSASSPAHLRVEWSDQSKDETGYKIWRRQVDTPEWHLAGIVPANATHFDDGGMQSDTAYEHRVAAFNAAGESAPANVAAPGRTQRLTAHLTPTLVRGIVDDHFAGAPSALGLPDGRLLLMFFLKDHTKPAQHMNTGVWQMESADRGKSWSKPRLFLAGDLQTAIGKPALVRLPDGDIGLTYSRFGLDSRGKIVARSRYFARSTDEGGTWSKGVLVSNEMSANNDTLIIGDRGRLIQALSGYLPAARITASDDLGATWRVLSEVAVDALPTGEAALAHLGAGRLVFLSRHEAPFYFLKYSGDNGKTWGGASTLYLGGGDNPPKITRIPGTETLVAIVHSWNTGQRSKDRRQLAAVISSDGGKSWDNFRLLGHFPQGDDGFLQHSVTFIGDDAYIFYGGGSSKDTGDGAELFLLRISKRFFLSTTPWPYGWNGEPLDPSEMR